MGMRDGNSNDLTRGDSGLNQQHVHVSNAVQDPHAARHDDLGSSFALPPLRRRA